MNLPDGYAEITVSLPLVVQSWRESIMAHEWLDKAGVKADKALKPERLERRLAVRAALAAGEVLEPPILGIGMFDNVEVGRGADVVATLSLDGVQSLKVHVRAGQVGEFAPFIVA